ncbi:MAG: SCO family protein [Acidobacteria bacterium]|nr:SCO family protein [Acidobacteriota bacterium]
MQNVTRRNLLGFLSLAPATPLAGHPIAKAARAAESDSSARGLLQRRNFPNLKLQNQDGQEVRFYDDLIKNKIVTINFFYAKCEGICPTVTANLAKAQKILGNRVGREIFMTSISLKPEHDTPAVLKEYAQMFRAQPGWSFLTGKPDDVEHLRRSLGFTNLDPRLDKDTSQHIGNVRIGNEALMLWAACPGMARPEFIAKSVLWMIRKG